MVVLQSPKFTPELSAWVSSHLLKQAVWQTSYSKLHPSVNECMNVWTVTYHGLASSYCVFLPHSKFLGLTLDLLNRIKGLLEMTVDR